MQLRGHGRYGRARFTISVCLTTGERKMRNLSIGLAVSMCLSLIAGPCLGLTPTDPNTSDGIIESDPPVLWGSTWETDELMDNDSGTEFYLTWGDTAVYCAIKGPFADQEDSDYDWFIAFDIDLTPGSGAPMDGYSHVSFPGDFRPEFVYCFTGGMGWYESCEWDWAEGVWTWRGWQNVCSYGGWNDTLVTEICIPYSMLWGAVSLAVVSWISDENQTEIVASFPSANTVGPTSYEDPRAMNHVWVADYLGQGIAPNTLLVEPPPPPATVDNERSYPFTCTAMADITPGNCGMTTQMTFYYTIDGSEPDSTSTFVVGTYDSCKVGGDTTDTFYAVIPAPDESSVTWIAWGSSKIYGAVDWSDTSHSFIQGGTAWLGNEGSSPTTCTVWAEIYAGDEGQTTWMMFPYTSDGSDPRTSPETNVAEGLFDWKAGNNDRYYAVLEESAPGDTIRWYAFGRDLHDNYAESDTTFMFVQGDTADILNLICEPDSNYVVGEVGPGGWEAGMTFYWTTDGTDPRTSETRHLASGYHVEDTDTTTKFGAYLTANQGEVIKWYVHAWASDNSFGDSHVQECLADTTSGPTLCNLTCVPESIIVMASISPRGLGAEIEFRATHDGSDPRTSPNVGVIQGSWLRDEDSPGGDCGSSAVGVFYAQFPGEEGDTIKWYAHGWYQQHHKYCGLFGDSPVQICVAGTSIAGLEAPSARSLVTRVSSMPNPFGKSTQIVFELARRSEVKVVIYDTRGRIVATLFDGTLSQGENVITWDGRNGSDEELSPGIYFYRLKAGDLGVTKKIILVK